MGQRLVRAKAKIRQAGIPFRVPERADLGERLDTVLEAIYATYTEGWSDPAGTETRHRNLAEEGIWLGRLLVSLMPGEPEALAPTACCTRGCDFNIACKSRHKRARRPFLPLPIHASTRIGAGSCSKRRCFSNPIATSTYR